MDVNGPGSVHSAFPIKHAQPVSDVRPSAASRSVAPQDEVQISEAGKILEHLNQSSELRGERLAQIKAAIDADTYETSDKLEAALQRLLDEVGYQNGPGR